MADNPTIVAASLSDDELKKSVDSLVSHVEEAMKKMVTSTNNAVGEMEKKLKSLGDIKVDSNGSDDGGASRRTKAQNAETDAIERSNRAYKEKAVALDQMAKAQQVAIRSANPDSVRNADTLQTMRINLDLLVEKLREARNQYSAYVAMARDASTTGDKGYYQMATAGVHRYEEEVKNTIAQIRELRTGIAQMGDVIAPQGHTLQNYVNSLVKANPELAKLNDQFKRGQSLLQQQKTEFEMNAQAQRNSADATNQSKESLEALNRASERTIHEERERRDAILQTGQAARETANELIKQAYEQASADGEDPITGAKELSEALTEMRRAYFEMSAEDKLSPIGRALEEDIKRANEAITVIQGYNKSRIGNNQQNKHEITNQSSLVSLRESLKDLTDQYNKLTLAEIAEGRGDEVIRKFQRTTRAAQMLQRTLNTPLTLADAKSSPERTLDDIIYKIQRLQAYKRVIPLDDSKSLELLDQTDREINRLNRDLNKYMSTTKQTTELNNVLGRSWAYMKNRLAFYFTVGASTAFIQNLIDVRSQYEMNERALGILINSAERGTQVFRELSEMALVSPYTLIELSTAAKQLTAYDIAAKDVVDTTRRLADISAAVGVPVERFTYALGQVKAFGHLTSQDARQFLNTGVPLVKQLAKHYTELEGRLVSTADVYDRMKKHAVSYNDVLLVLNEMTDEGGKFFDYQAKMAETLKVQLANLTLAWNNMLNDIGSQTQGILSTGISGLKELFLHWQTLDRILWNLAITLGTAKASMLLLNVTFGKGTLATIRNMMATEGATAANYRYALSKANIGKVEAKWLLSLQKNNVALKEAIAQMNLLTTAEINASSKATLFGVNLGRVGMIGKSTLLGIGSLARAAGIGISMLGKSLLALVTNPAFIGFALVSALMDAILYSNQLDDQMKAMNQNIANGAKEASKSMGDFLKESAMVANRQKALNNALSPEEGEKTWNALREQIELSSDASETFISALLREEDINQRISKGFDIADKIREATEAMPALDEEALKVSQDSWLNGFFGEGVGEDLEDYIEMIKEFREEASSRGLGGNAIMQWAKDTQNQNEMKREMQTLADDVAQVLRDRLGEGISDPVKIREALERIKKEIKAANPQIRGEVANFFDVDLETLLQPKFKALGNENVALQQQFLQILKRDYASAFANITDNILEENARWGKDQEDAIRRAAEKFKTITVPEFHSAIDDMVKYMNSQDWRIRITTVMGTAIRSDFQKEWDARFGGNGVYNAYRPTQNAELPAYIKEQQDAIKKLREDIVTFSKVDGAYAKQKKQDSEDELRTREQIVKAYNQPLEKETKKSGSGGSKKDILGDALAKEVQLIGEIQKRYKEYQQMGVNAQEAIRLATEEYGNTLKRTNATLAKYGISTKTSEELAGMDIRDVRDYYKSLLEMAKSTGNAKGIEAIEKALASINVEITKLDYKKITDGLNNELSKLKDEYELAIELDADPELGNMFAEMWGIDLDALPRTAQEYAKVATQSLNKYLREAKTGIEIDDVLGLTDEDLGFLDDLLASESITQAAYDLIQKVVKGARDARNKEIKDSISGYEKLLEKYGGLQAKITKIYKDSVKEQIDIVRKFGDDEQVKDALDLSRQINLSQDPAEIARLQEQLAKILNDVTKGKPIALKTYQATQKQQKTQISKAYWEDFKDSDLYAMTFEDTANLSNRAIDTMIDKLEELKDRVKESPKDMEALIKAKNELEKTKNERNPFGAIVDGIEEWVNATKKVEQARERLVLANQNVAIAETQLAQAEENGLSDEVLRKQEQLNKAKKEQEEATTNVTKAENEQKKASIKVRMGMENLANSMNKIKGVFDGVSQVFRMFGDDETADAIDEISKGFSIMASMIMAVVAAMIVLESTVPWLLAIAAALGVIVGLVSFLSGQENKRIDKKIKESEQEVKKLENAYKLLNNEVEDAYGTMVMGARQAVKANKELQLAELKRQLALEQSRDSKHRDEDRIIELRGQIIDLEREVNKATEETLNAILGISSHGDFFEDLISSMIDAFKQGEDAMEVFEEKWDEMIDNMIMKTIVQRFLSTWVESLEQGAEDIINKYTKETSKEKADLAKKISDQQQMDAGDLGEWLYANNKEYYIKLAEQVSDGQLDYNRLQWADSSWGAERLLWFNEAWRSGLAQKIADAYYADAEGQMKVLDQKIADETLSATKDLINYYGGAKEDFKTNYMPSIMEAIKENFTFGQDNEKELSALQRGISSITEETAGALEAITNGISQQCYLQSDLLTQIRDTVQSFDIDVQTSTFAEMLLQLQQSYQVQMSIESILQGVLVPSGRAFAVEIQ